MLIRGLSLARAEAFQYVYKADCTSELQVLQSCLEDMTVDALAQVWSSGYSFQSEGNYATISSTLCPTPTGILDAAGSLSGDAACMEGLSEATECQKDVPLDLLFIASPTDTLKCVALETTSNPAPSPELVNQIETSPAQDARETQAIDGVSVVDILALSPEVSVLVSKLQLAGLDGILQERGPFTLLAPNNAAFDNTYPEKLDTEEYRAHLVDLLTYHVISSVVLSDEMLFLDGTTETLNGESVVVTSLDPPTLNTAVVLTPDLIAENGAVHILDDLLLPRSFQEDAFTSLIMNPALSTLMSLTSPVPETILELFQGAGPITIFAPSNQAFSNVEDLPTDTDLLIGLFQYHVTSGIVLSSALTEGMVLTMENGSTATITIDPVPTIGNATIIGADILVNNGVIHIIDSVLQVGSPSVETLVPSMAPTGGTETFGPTTEDEGQSTGTVDRPTLENQNITFFSLAFAFEDFEERDPTDIEVEDVICETTNFITDKLSAATGESDIITSAMNIDWSFSESAIYYPIVVNFTIASTFSTTGVDVPSDLVSEATQFNSDDIIEYISEYVWNGQAGSVFLETKSVNFTMVGSYDNDQPPRIASVDCPVETFETVPPAAGPSLSTAPFYLQSLEPNVFPSESPTSTLVSESPTDGRTQVTGPIAESVWTVIEESPSLLMFALGLTLVNLDKALDDTNSSFTVFAPSSDDLINDDVFPFYRDNLETWVGHVTEILQYHIWEGPFSSEALFAEDLPYFIWTLAGGLAGGLLEVNPIERTVGNASLTGYTRQATNGYVHEINGLVDWDWKNLTMLEVLDTEGGFEDFLGAFETRLDFGEYLSAYTSENGTTLLAPLNNAASASLGYHVITQNVYQESLGDTSYTLVETLDTSDIWASTDAEGTMRYNSVIVGRELFARNG